VRNECAIHDTLSFVGKKWTLLVLLELYKGKAEWKRYSQLKRQLPGITPKMLAARLRELTELKLIEKRVDASTTPIKSEYMLTDSGKAFIKVIRELKKWTLKWGGKNRACEKSACRTCELKV